MLLLDNFRVIILFGIICTSGIPSINVKGDCAQDATSDIPLAKCDASKGPNCAIDPFNGVPGGCVIDDKCPAMVGPDFKCDTTATYCCCLPAPGASTPCNAIWDPKVLKTFCDDPVIKGQSPPWEKCKACLKKLFTLHSGGGDPDNGGGPVTDKKADSSGMNLSSSIGTMVTVLCLEACGFRGTFGSRA